MERRDGHVRADWYARGRHREMLLSLDPWIESTGAGIRRPGFQLFFILS